MFYRVLRWANRRARFKKRRLRDRIHGVIDRVYFNEKKVIRKEKRKILFHSTAWGGHLDWFFSYTVPSALQDGNIPSLYRDGYNLRLDLYTHPEEYESAAETYRPVLESLGKYMTINPIYLRELHGDWLQGYYGQIALIDQIKTCIDEDATMFFAAPDMIFGNSSISNAVKMVHGKNVDRKSVV